MIMTENVQREEDGLVINSSGNLDITYKALKDLSENNAKFFNKDTSENGQRMNLALLSIKDNIDSSWPVIEELRELAVHYDFDEHTPGNGYRTFIYIYNLAVKLAIQINRKVLLKRDGVLFRKAYYTK